MKFYIVDDCAERAEAFIGKIKSYKHEYIWFRPELDVSIKERNPPKDNEIRINTKDDLLKAIKSVDLKQISIWLWDIVLEFPSGKISDGDYKKNNSLQLALFELLKNGHIISLISSSSATAHISQEWNNINPKFEHQVIYSTSSWQIFDDENKRNKWVDDVINQSLATANRGISDLWNKPNWDKHFIDGGLGLQHSFSKQSWENFLPIISECLGVQQLPSPIAETIKKNFEGYFEALKTLIGTHAKCHVGENKPPCIGVLPILFLRAAIKSGKWNEQQLVTLASNFKLEESCRTVFLCSEHQSKDQIREWLCFIEDNLFLLLVENHKRTAKANILKCEIKTDTSKFFRIQYNEAWLCMAKTIHNISSGGGNTYESLRKSATLLGDCGEKVGFDARTIVNARVINNKTEIEFRVS